MDITKKHLYLALAVLIAGVGVYTASLGVANYLIAQRQPESKTVAAQEAPLAVLLPETSNIVTVAGTTRLIGDGGLATAATISSPRNLLFDPSGNLYIAYEVLNRIRKVDAVTGVITTVAGNGIPGFSGDGGLATAAQLNAPSGLALDPSGNLYIADEGNHRIRKLNLATGIITSIAGTGVQGFSGDGGLATAATFNFPWKVALDASGNLFIADFSNRRVRRVDAVTGVITTVVGNGSQATCSNAPATACGANSQCPIGGTCLNGDSGPATAARFNAPWEVAFDASGNLFMADRGANRVRKIVPGTDGLVNGAADEIITTVAGTGIAGYNSDNIQATSAQINLHEGLNVDASGNLYIADTANQRVRRVDAVTGVITTVAGTGTAGFSGDGGLATAAQLNSPGGFAFDVSGNWYIADLGNGRVRKVDTAGNISTIAGGGSFPSGDGGPATAAQVIIPSQVAFDVSGNMHIAAASQVRRVDAVTGVITTVAGTGVQGFSGDGGLATAAQIRSIPSIAFDSSDNLYIADNGNHRVRKIDTVTGIISTVAGIGVAGFSGDNGTATLARINAPTGITFDNAGNLYISGNQRIRKVNSAGIITTIAGTGAACPLTTPSSAFCGDGGPATSATFRAPNGIVVDSGSLYIADTNNRRVRRIDLATGIISTVAGANIVPSSVPAFSGDGGPAKSAQINDPDGIAFDTSHNLYIGAFGGNRVRKVVPGSDGVVNGGSDEIISTVAGTGVSGFSGDGGPATAAWFASIDGLTVDSSGNLYIADLYNNRVRRSSVAVQVNVDPDTLNIANSTGNWVTAYIQFPAGRDASEVYFNTVRLQAIDPATGGVRHDAGNAQVLQTGRAPGSPKALTDTNGDEMPDRLMLKFDRATVASWATDAPELVLRVEGQFQGPVDGTYFSGDTQIRNVYPPMGGGVMAPQASRLDDEVCDPELDPDCELAE